MDTYHRDANILTLVSIEESRSDGEQRIADGLPSETSTPDAVAQHQSVRDQVVVAIDGLAERDQTIVRLYYYEDRSFKEIGDLLGVTESRVSQLHSRIKRRLREALEQEGEISEAA
jgi:RNA polymerase sigma factor for flagellar operon FliA